MLPEETYASLPVEPEQHGTVAVAIGRNECIELADFCGGGIGELLQGRELRRLDRLGVDGHELFGAADRIHLGAEAP